MLNKRKTAFSTTNYAKMYFKHNLLLLLGTNKLEMLNELYSLTLNVKRHTRGEICERFPVWAIALFFVKSGQRSSFIST